MSEPSEVPYRLSFQDGLQPIDIAWVQVAEMPTAAFDEIAGTHLADRPNASDTIGLGFTGLGEKESAALVDHQSKTTTDLTKFRETMRANLVRAGIDEAKVTHLVNVFTLGILVGREEASLIETYTKQGIDEIDQES